MTWISRLLNRSVPGVLNQGSRVITRRSRHRETRRERMHEIIVAIKRHKTFFITRIVLGYLKSSAITCTSSLLNERLDGACMLNSARPTFRESFKIVPRVLMVSGGQSGYLPTEFQGLKGWRRRWVHSAITYI